ncbi:sensor histidine kinase [Hymenobacter sp. B81]|uniref:sensor histidine kinase n=1 Tax=Hymenobacter sp. B81 TaxID=3344878 RepID=UPI0037DDB938
MLAWLFRGAFGRWVGRSDAGVVLVYWLVVAPLLLLEYVPEFGWARAVPGTVFTIALDTLTVLLAVRGLLPRLLTPGRRVGGLALLAGFIGLSGAAYLAGLVWVFGQPLKWSGLALLYGAVSHARSYGLLAVVLTGKHYHDAQQRLLGAQKAQAESELRALKAQIDPHFLFNNLNILHVLIAQDADVASHYLDRFAGLYRYLIRHKDADFVPLGEELAFFDDYVYLLRHRFGEAYAFEVELTPGADPARLHVVPGTLQILIENATKHNRGDDDEPLRVVVRVQAEALQVSNPVRPKRRAPESGGTGLLNLQARYRILTGQVVQVQRGTDFVVRVPLLRQTQRRPAEAPLLVG